MYSQTASFVWDEGFHLLAAQLILAGKKPYIDFCFPQTPLNTYLNAAWMRIFGQSWRGVHLLATLALIGAIYLTADFVFARCPVRRWRLPGAIAAAFLLGTNLSVVEFATCAQAYAMCMFFAVAAFRVSVVAIEQEGLFLPFAAGLLSGGGAGFSLLIASDGWSGNGVSSQPITASDGEGVLGDDVSWVRGKHVLQGGALYIFGIKRQNVFTTPQGSFSFSGVHTGDPAADYLLGLDASYYQASSQKLGSYHYRQGEAYFEDDWKATPKLTLNLGLRWVYFSSDTVSGNQVTSFEPQLYNAAAAPVVTPTGSFVLDSAGNPITSGGTPADLLNGLAYAGQNGVPSGFFIPKKTNFAPRVGFAFTPDANRKTAIRGGYGIGYSRIPLEAIYAAFGQNPPYNESANITNSLLSVPTAGTTAAPTPQTLSDAPSSFTPTRIQSYSLTVDRQIASNMTASIAYVGSLSQHIVTFQGGYDANFPLPVSTPSQAGCLAPGQTPSASYDFDPCINTGASSPNYTRPYQGYAAMDDVYDEGYSNYNSLQASGGYRGHGSQFTVAYTYGKALTTVGSHSAGGTTSQGVAAQNMRDFHAEYGPPSYDFTHDITGTWVWQIPVFEHGSKFLTAPLGGWSFSGLAVHQSGFAMSPGLGIGTAGLAIRPNQVAKYQKIGSLTEWFNTADYVPAPYGFFGNAGNGQIRGPAYTSANASLDKTFPIHERLKIQFRAEAFNILNHPNFSSVDTGYGDGSYGQVTSARDPRILEFAAKFTF